MLAALGAPASDLRQWLRAGIEGKLERAVLSGQGRRLLSEAETLPLSRYLLNLISKCEALHAAIETGSLLNLQVNHTKIFPCLDKLGNNEISQLCSAAWSRYISACDSPVISFTESRWSAYFSCFMETSSLTLT